MSAERRLLRLLRLLRQDSAGAMNLLERPRRFRRHCRGRVDQRLRLVMPPLGRWLGLAQHLALERALEPALQRALLERALDQARLMGSEVL